MSSKSLFDGIENPNGLLMAAFGPVFLAAIPVTNYLTTPNSFVQKTVETLLAAIPGGSAVPSDRVIPALAAVYIFWTFAATGAISVAALGASTKKGLDNNHPRKNANNLTGLPLRLRSAHFNTMEMFPGFALAAALAQVIDPANQEIKNLLALHVLLKMGVYYPGYVFNVAPVRSLAHLGATASVINVAWKLAVGSK